MEPVIGIGGTVLRAKDPAGLLGWYRDHLGIRPAFESGTVFAWRDPDDPKRAGMTTWTPVSGRHGPSRVGL